MNELITVKQLPVIQEELRSLRERWQEKVEDARSMVCTEETVQAIKGIRAEMRKEFDEADSQRKLAKSQYMAPWDEVEAVFRECVKESFAQADDILKTTIGEYEGRLKQECYEKLKEFFAELVAMEHIDFLTLEQAMKLGGIKISMADAKKNLPTRLQDSVASVVASVATGMEQIGKMDDAAEIMTEFKQCFDVGRSVAIVQERKRKVQAEKEAEEQRRASLERFREAEEKVLSASPVVVAPAEEQANYVKDPIFDEFTFTVYGARKSQLLKIRELLKQEGIRYV